jgi:pentatricopeptide repeat protein
MREVTPAPAAPVARAVAGESEVDPLPDYDPEDVAGGAPELTPPRPAETAAGAPAPMPATTATAMPIATPIPPPTPVAIAPASTPAAISTTPTSFVPVTPSAAAPAAPAAPAAKSAGGDALQTNTLAELYVKQGLVDRAVEVYRGMLKVDPANERARRRLEELQAAPAPEGAAAAAATVVARPSSQARVLPAMPAPAAPAPAASAPAAPATPAPARPAAPAAFADPAAASRAAAIRRLEEWLVLMQSGKDTDRRAGR